MQPERVVKPWNEPQENNSQGLIPEKIRDSVRKMLTSGASGNLKINFRQGAIIGYTVEQHVTLQQR